MLPEKSAFQRDLKLQSSRLQLFTECMQYGCVTWLLFQPVSYAVMLKYVFMGYVLYCLYISVRHYRQLHYPLVRIKAPGEITRITTADKVSCKVKNFYTLGNTVCHIRLASAGRLQQLVIWRDMLAVEDWRALHYFLNSSARQREVSTESWS